jgi:DNA-binding response OmpR family regulator
MRSLLLVSPEEPDHLSLGKILQPAAWTVLRAQDPMEAWQVLLETTVDVVIADSQFWKSLLAQMWKSGFRLIVAARLADERLWAEVLNLGAYDLIAKPFESEVILQVLKSACRASFTGGSEDQQGRVEEPPRWSTRDIQAAV